MTSDPSVVHLWRAHLAFEARLAAALSRLGLTVAEFRLVGEVLAAPDGLRQGELARRLGVRAPTVSAAVQKLEQAGVLARSPDPADPRARVVRIAAVAPVQAGADVLHALDGDALRGLDHAERAALRDLLDRVARNLAAPEPP